MNKAILQVLANLKNASKTQKLLTVVYYSQKSVELCELLFKNGFIAGYRHMGNKIIIKVKYLYLRKPLISDIEIYSRPSRKLFITYNNLLKDHSIYETLVLSTTAGYLTLYDAYQMGLGGELLFKIN